mmetsp:Transcript_25297/g.22313  ORF Transcript_25297/g.22313 Transcript_25297/m.22313 type:complete len:266 (-) Transcript_25297:39-836(-)
MIITIQDLKFFIYLYVASHVIHCTKDCQRFTNLLKGFAFSMYVKKELYNRDLGIYSLSFSFTLVELSFHLEVLSVVLVSARINNNLISEELIVHELGKWHTLKSQTVIVVSNMGQAETFGVLASKHLISDLITLVDGILLGREEHTSKTNSSTGGNSSFLGSSSSEAFPVIVTDGVLDLSVEVLPESSLVTSIRVFLSLPEFLELPIVLLAHGSVNHLHSFSFVRSMIIKIIISVSSSLSPTICLRVVSDPDVVLLHSILLSAHD